MIERQEDKKTKRQKDEKTERWKYEKTKICKDRKVWNTQLHLHFGPFGPMTEQETMQTRCLCGFSFMWVPKLFLLSLRIRIFWPKRAKFGPKLAFLVILSQAFPAHLVPLGGLVGGCGARAVSCKTSIYSMISKVKGKLWRREGYMVMKRGRNSWKNSN